MLEELATLVHREREAQAEKTLTSWALPLPQKLKTGITQAFGRLERTDDPRQVWAHLKEDDNESRFREGDMLVLHEQVPTAPLTRGAKLLSDEGERWLLEVKSARELFDGYSGGDCFADADYLDLTSLFEQAFEEIRQVRSMRDRVMPLLRGEQPPRFDVSRSLRARRVARSEGLNERQQEAVELAHAAESIACIQGPPGTGKTRVLSLVARLAVEQGQRVLVTSHTHTAINHALNKIAAHRVLAVKIGALEQTKGLDPTVTRSDSFDAWEKARASEGGFVVGATPFSTFTRRLHGVHFDLVIFDEASQVTVPLAVMAMRVGKRFVFIGDSRQLPPVLLSRSVLDDDSGSVFERFSFRAAKHSVMLEETYRMNDPLTRWASSTYYGGALRSVGEAACRRLRLDRAPEAYPALLAPEPSAIFLATLDIEARARSDRDAELVADLCGVAHAAGLPLDQMAVVTPFRAQGRAVRRELARRLGGDRAKRIVADTVERMQGQERELIILSLAAGDQAYLGAISSFFFQPERLNVSMTRAKTKLIVIGPEPERLPDVECLKVQQWIRQYASMVEQCARVAL